ncbi:MAG: hypothetical protein M1816_005385 [Peltula sp. TS41687]|nr:MAG: hypothetical protein M1816_005385 [Peltula sp. TS41687]
MSQATKEMLLRARKMIPPMLENFHKGQMGRVAVIGGSEECLYRGAIFLCYGFCKIRGGESRNIRLIRGAISTSGADMSHVICEPQASLVIKTYSPNLMVHPYMRQSHHVRATETQDLISARVIEMLSRLHVLVIGPGLGRDAFMHETCARVIVEARKRMLPFILDADGLMLAQMQPELVRGYRFCILTPNVTEFARLAQSQGIDLAGPETELCAKLAEAYGGVTVIQKGARDYISNGERTLVSDIEGGRKRSGGQGDTLTGSLATFLAWRKAYLDRIWDHDNSLDEKELFILAAFAGSSLTRECSRLAFQKKGRSLQAGDLTEEVYQAYLNLFEGSASKI